MTIKEVVFEVPNKPGQLSYIISQLYENDVTVPAFWVGTENGGATLRLIVSDPQSAVSVLTGLGFNVTTVDVIAARVPHHPGGLNSILKILQAAQINILHIYPCLETEEAILILEVDRTDDAVKLLKNNWIDLYDERLYSM